MTRTGEEVQRDRSHQSPRLPNAFEEGVELTLEEDATLSHVTIQADVSGGLTIEETRITRSSFVATDLLSAQLTDVLIVGADFSGANFEEASLKRVEFRDCRMRL